MATEWRYLLPRSVRHVPADIAAAVLWTLATVISVGLPVVRETPLRIVLGFPFLLFFPGYALLAVLFPEASGSDSELDAVDELPDAVVETSTTRIDSLPGFGGTPGSGIDGLERALLSFGLSLAIVPLLLLGVNYTPWGLRLWPMVAAVGGFTVLVSSFAVVRRRSLPVEERFSVPYRDWLDSTRDEIFNPLDRTDAFLNVLLAVSLLLVLVSGTYALTVPTEGEKYTELYVLTEDEDRLVAADYPEELTAGESTELVLGVGNNEFEPANYTVVAQLQQTEVVDNETRVIERYRLDRLGFSLSHNETELRRHTIVPNVNGTSLRLKYLLYRGEPPERPTAENAYRDIHVFLDVNPRDER